MDKKESGCLGFAFSIALVIIVISLIRTLLISIINVFTGNIFFVIIASLISILWLVLSSFKSRKKKKLSLNIFLIYILPGMIVYFTLYKVNATSGIDNLSSTGGAIVTIFSILAYYLLPIFYIISVVLAIYFKRRMKIDEHFRLLNEKSLEEKHLLDLKLQNFLDSINKELSFLDLNETFYYVTEVADNKDVQFNLFNENKELHKVNIPIVWMGNSNIYNYLNENIYLLNKFDNLNKKLQYYKSQLSNQNLFKSNYFKYFDETLKSTMLTLETLKNSYSRDYEIANLGAEGESLVNDGLRLHSNIINLEGYQLKYNETSVECDNILITPRGVFVLEIKNYASKGQYEIYIDETGRWEKRSSKYRSSMDSPITQNDRHIAVVNTILNHELNTSLDNSIEANSIIVISNNNLNIINNSNYKSILRPGQIYNFIQKYPVIYSEKDIFALKAALEKYQVATKKYPVHAYKEVEKYLDSAEKFYDDISNILIKMQKTF